MDALGIQNYYNLGVRHADPVMNRIASNAKAVFGASLPDGRISLKKSDGNKLVIMNDTVFFFSPKIEHTLYFASKFTKQMFVPEKNVDPIAFRGAVAETESIPKIVLSEDTSISVAKFVIDNISAAMIAEKKKILGPRIFVPTRLIDHKHFSTLDFKYQALIMDISKMSSIKSDTLGQDFKEYCDVAWMIGFDDAQDKKIHDNIVEFWKRAVFSARASSHASAAMALYKACQIKKKNIYTVVEKLYSGLKKSGMYTEKFPSNATFEDVLTLGQGLQRDRGNIMIGP